MLRRLREHGIRARRPYRGVTLRNNTDVTDWIWIFMFCHGQHLLLIWTPSNICWVKHFLPSFLLGSWWISFRISQASCYYSLVVLVELWNHILLFYHHIQMDVPRHRVFSHLEFNGEVIRRLSLQSWLLGCKAFLLHHKCDCYFLNFAPNLYTWLCWCFLLILLLLFVSVVFSIFRGFL